MQSIRSGKLSLILLPMCPCLLAWLASDLGFYFYKVRSPTPYMFTFSGLLAISTLDVFSSRCTFLPTPSWCTYFLVSSSRSFSPIISDECFCWWDVSYILPGPPYLILVPRCGCHHVAPLTRLTGASFPLPGLRVFFVIAPGA